MALAAYAAPTFSGSAGAPTTTSRVIRPTSYDGLTGPAQRTYIAATPGRALEYAARVSKGRTVMPAIGRRADAHPHRERQHDREGPHRPDRRQRNGRSAHLGGRCRRTGAGRHRSATATTG